MNPGYLSMSPMSCREKGKGEKKSGSISKLNPLPLPTSPSRSLGGETLQSKSLESVDGVSKCSIQRRFSADTFPGILPNYPVRKENGALPHPGHPSPRRDVRPPLSRWTRRCWSARAPPEPPLPPKWVPGQRGAKSQLGSPEETPPGSWRARLGRARPGPRHCC